MSGGGSSGGGSQNTVTQTTQIPEWQKDFAIQNEQIAASLASRPYPTYQGQLIAGFTPLQDQGIQRTMNAADSYHSDLLGGELLVGGAQGAYQPLVNAAGQQINQATANYQPALAQSQNYTQGAAQGWNNQAAQDYMSPYVMQSLAPQLAQLDIKHAQNRNQIGAGANRAGAYGDARHGVADSLNNFYSDIERQGVIGQGMNSAFSNAQQAFMTDQQRQLGAGAQMGTLAQAQQQLALNPAQAYSGLAQDQNNMILNTGQTAAQMGAMRQQLGLQGASSVFDAGTQQQQLQQQQLSAAYQNFMNQANWPTEQLNMRIAALANSPYSTVNQTSLAPANATAMNVGAFGALAGGVGSLLNGGAGGSRPVFGGG